MAKKTPESFENNLEELEAIVAKLEKGDLSLDDSLQQFERGISLARNCQTLLKNAQQKVEVLSQKDESSEPDTFNTDSQE